MKYVEKKTSLERMTHPVNGRYKAAATRRAINAMRRLEAYENRQKYKEEYKENPDTVARRDVHNLIISMIVEGKSKAEILITLNNKYPNTSITKNFSQYIDDQMKKIKIKEDVEER